jgi:hypothetical protein
MPYNVLLLPLLGGFIFITFWDRTRWHAFRAEKERLLLYAALAGFACLAAAILIRSLFRYFITEPVCPWWNRNVGFPHSGVATLALLLGTFGWYPLNRVADWWFKEWAEGDESGSKRREFVRVVDNYGGPLEQLLLRSMEQRQAVMLTLKGGKVYIGKVLVGFTPERDKTIYLLPQRSGYRDDKQRLELTTPYDKIYLQIEEHEENATDVIGTFGIVVKVEEVIAASLYLPEIHSKYFSHVQEEKQPDPVRVVGQLVLTEGKQVSEEPLDLD